MKNFQENVDEASINQVKADRFADTRTTARPFRQRVVQFLSRYSLFIIVGLAALSITVLHFQGQFLLQALRGTPLPIFGVEEKVDDSPLPDKTDVYEQALSEEAKQVTRPSWQTGYHQPTVAPDTTTQDSAPVNTAAVDTAAVDTAAVDTVVVQEPPAVKRTVRKKRQVKKSSEVAPPPVAETAVSFFQPVKATSSPDSNPFLSCVVHGNQQVANRTRLVLRLVGPATMNGQTIPLGTLIYGTARLLQDRIQVTIAQMGQQPVNYQVYDHTYHPGILLTEQDEGVQQVGRETAFRQTLRNTYRLPSQIASEVARDLLQQTRRTTPSVFLPDGYPLYISSTQP